MCLTGFMGLPPVHLVLPWGLTCLPALLATPQLQPLPCHAFDIILWFIEEGVPGVAPLVPFMANLCFFG